MANLSWKRIGTDLAGYGCLLAVPFVGWLPGPGGIPLIIAGLGLLSIHNAWAKRLLIYVKKHSESLQDVLFPDQTLIKWLWDLFVLGLLVGGTMLSIYAEAGWLRLAAIPLFTVGFFVFMLNRNRLKWLTNLGSKHKK